MRQSGNNPKFPEVTDYRVGGETALKPKKRTSDWKQYAPAIEKQYAPTFDTLSCTSFSFNNVVEFQLNYMIATKELPDTTIKWLTDNGYIEADGKVNLSDRFLAIMSGTTERGNDFRTVAETARTVGCIPEKDLPLGNCTTFAEYHNKALITQAMKDKALKFLELVSIQWDWLFFDSTTGFNEEYQVKDNIEATPIQIGITTPATHATCLYGYVSDTKVFKVYDTYEPFYFEGSAENYNPQIGARILVTAKEQPPMPPMPPATFTFKTVLVYKMRHTDVVQLQRVLINFGFLKVGLDTGLFWDRTLQAVKNFQMYYGITPTGNVGQVTMAKLNSLLGSKKKLTISDAGLKMLIKFEGLGDGNRKTSILEPYQDQTGTWTIGYGNTYINGVKVTRETPPITQEQAMTLLLTSLESYQETVRRSVAVDLKQDQYDALVSFCFNCGSLLGLKDKINLGTITKDDFMQYVYSKGKKLPVLVSRRQQEADYYFSS